MNLAAVLLWEVRSSLRTLVPHPWIRRGALGILGAVALLGSALMLLMPLPRGAGARAGTGILAGVVMGALPLGVAAALGGASALLRRPERARLAELAPLPPLMAATLPMASLAATTLLPFGLFFLPFVLAALRLAPAQAALLLLCGAAMVGWAMTAALGLAVALTRARGREAAGRMTGAGAFALTLASLWLLPRVLRWTTGRGAALAFLLASLWLLPRWGAALARRFLALLQEGEPAKSAPEPTWGAPSWGRILLRTPAAWAVLGSLPALLLLARGQLPLRWGATALLLLSAEAAPLGHLLAAEHACPDRWRLAPEGGRMRLRLLVQVGGAAAAAALALAAVLGRGHGAWLAATAALILTFPLTSLVPARLPRQLLQDLGLLAALLTQAFA